MSVFFLYPIFLFGLIAASLPLLIHLLNRRKLNRIRFPAVRFILMSQKRISRSYRLRHWILLALRTMAATPRSQFNATSHRGCDQTMRVRRGSSITAIPSTPRDR